MPTGLTSLPTEIRDMIWDELLLVNRRPSDTHKWTIATQLFTVNKAFSAETQGFFYRKNAFVLVENFSTGSGTFLGQYGHKALSMIPIIRISLRISKLPVQPKIALRVRLNQGFNNATIGGPNAWEEFNPSLPFPSRKKLEQGIIPGQHLPRFIQLINCLRSPLFVVWEASSGGAPIYKLDLDFKTSTEDCYRDNGVAERLARGLKGLRQFHIFGAAAGGDYQGHFPVDRVLKERPVFNTELSINGLENEKVIQELLQESNYPAWTMQEAIAEAKNLVKQAKIHEARGEYGEAYISLNLSELMIGHNSVWPHFRCRYISQRTLLEITAILFDIMLAFHNLAWNLGPEERSCFLPHVDACNDIPGIVDHVLDSIVAASKFSSNVIPFKENIHLADGHASLYDIERNFSYDALREMQASLSHLCLRYCRYVLSVGYISKAYDEVRAGLEKDPGNLELQFLDNEIEETYNYQAMLRSEDRDTIENGWRMTAHKRMWDRPERIRVANNDTF